MLVAHGPRDAVGAATSRRVQAGAQPGDAIILAAAGPSRPRAADDARAMAVAMALATMLASWDRTIVLHR